MKLSNPFISYAEMYATFPRKDEISYADFRSILNATNSTILNTLIETGQSFKLPFNLGILGIFKRPISELGLGVFDYYHFNKTGEKREIKNKHSEGYMAKFYWLVSKNAGDVKNSSVYKYYPPRDYARLLAKKIKENNYIVKYY